MGGAGYGRAGPLRVPWERSKSLVEKDPVGCGFRIFTKASSTRLRVLGTSLLPRLS